jgi:hypothetical protein
MVIYSAFFVQGGYGLHDDNDSLLFIMRFARNAKSGCEQALGLCTRSKVSNEKEMLL